MPTVSQVQHALACAASIGWIILEDEKRSFNVELTMVERWQRNELNSSRIWSPHFLLNAKLFFWLLIMFCCTVHTACPCLPGACSAAICAFCQLGTCHVDSSSIHIWHCLCLDPYRHKVIFIIHHSTSISKPLASNYMCLNGDSAAWCWNFLLGLVLEF